MSNSYLHNGPYEKRSCPNTSISTMDKCCEDLICLIITILPKVAGLHINSSFVLAGICPFFVAQCIPLYLDLGVISGIKGRMEIVKSPIIYENMQHLTYGYMVSMAVEIV